MALRFSDFLQKLFTFCPECDNESLFVTTILEKAIFNMDSDDLTKKVAVFNMDENDQRKIYKGTKYISKTSARYILSHLDEAQLAEYIEKQTTDDARILLGKEFEIYIGNTDKDNIASKLANLLSKIIKEIAEKGKNATGIDPLVEITAFEVEKELTEIVKVLATKQSESLKIDLNYKPVNVDKKIRSNDAFKDDIRQYVIDYYRFVENLFKETSKQNAGIFDEIAKQVKYTSDNYISQGLPQEMIFDNMVDWLKKKVSFASVTACRIIIAFFVQNCEVFNEITK